MAEKWIQNAIKKPGALRAELGSKEVTSLSYTHGKIATGTRPSNPGDSHERLDH